MSVRVPGPSEAFDLTRGRRVHDRITLFRSVGLALEDLAAAMLALDKLVA